MMYGDSSKTISMVWFSFKRGERGGSGRRARTWTDKGMTARIGAGKGGWIRDRTVKRGR